MSFKSTKIAIQAGTDLICAEVWETVDECPQRGEVPRWVHGTGHLMISAEVRSCSPSNKTPVQFTFDAELKYASIRSWRMGQKFSKRDMKDVSNINVTASSIWSVRNQILEGWSRSWQPHGLSQFE